MLRLVGHVEHGPDKTVYKFLVRKPELEMVRQFFVKFSNIKFN